MPAVCRCLRRCLDIPGPQLLEPRLSALYALSGTSGAPIPSAGHVAVFYINKLRVAGIQTEPLDEHFEQIFEVGVDEVGKPCRAAGRAGQRSSPESVRALSSCRGVWSMLPEGMLCWDRSPQPPVVCQPACGPPLPNLLPSRIQDPLPVSRFL